MPESFEWPPEWEEQREKLLGLGERSLHKTFFPTLQLRLKELERFRTLLDHTNELIFLLEIPAGTLIDLNEHARLQLGLKPGDRLDPLLPPEDWAKLRPLFQEPQPGKRLTLTTSLQGPTGSYPVEMIFSFEPFGAQILCVAVARDITERLEAEETRIRLEQERERIRGMQEAQRLKDNFLSVVSHELRTPLNAITGFGSILEDEVPGTLNPKQHELLGKILESSERMLSLVNNLLDIARLQAGRFHLEIAPAPYPPIIARVVALLEPLAAKKGVQFEVHTDVSRPLPVDEEKIGQVLINLIDNAIKFSPSQGKIAVRAMEGPQGVLTEVQDQGIGIAPENLSRLFIPFQQLDMGLTRRVGGTGLGLSIAKGIVEAHGGWVEAESPGLGKGTTIRFFLPFKA